MPFSKNNTVLEVYHKGTHRYQKVLQGVRLVTINILPFQTQKYSITPFLPGNSTIAIINYIRVISLPGRLRC